MKLNKSLYNDYEEYPEKIIQFGEGNFLRAFADWIIDKMNKELDFNSGVLVVQPRDKDKVYKLNEQDGLYTVLLNGVEDGQTIKEKEIINSISRGLSPYVEYDSYLKAAENPELRFMISNTTEAGIVYHGEDKLEDRPQNSFPGKLTSFLYHRYKTFNGDSTKGLLLLPCELIDRNGDILKETIVKMSENWDLEQGFINWIKNDNIFYNTLVDRIVSGYPKEDIAKIEEELAYKDDFLVEGEIFHLWVIEGPKKIKDEFPVEKLGLNVVFVDDLEPYRERKVRILNGAHTSLVPVAYLYGLDTVREATEHNIIGNYLKSVIFDEIVPTLDLDKEELLEFADAVIDRFKNPFMNHYLIDISLNSMSKFKARVLPSIIEYKNKTGKLPEKLVFSLAALIYFYKGDRNGEEIKISDDKYILKTYQEVWSQYEDSNIDLSDIVKSILGLEELWETDLNRVENLEVMTTYYLEKISKTGINKALEEVLVCKDI